MVYVLVIPGYRHSVNWQMKNPEYKYMTTIESVPLYWQDLINQSLRQYVYEWIVINVSWVVYLHIKKIGPARHVGLLTDLKKATKSF